MTSERAGLSLVEVLVSLLLLAVGVSAVASTQMAMTRWRRLSSSRLDVEAQAEAKLDELRMIAASPTRPDTTQLRVGGATQSDLVTTPDGVGLRREWEVTQVFGGLLQVTVTVRPTVERPNYVQSLTLTTRIAR